MQLVAYGAQDIYLTGNPQITFFKVVYRRHTNFSMECIAQTFNGSKSFGSKVTATISRNGDLVSGLYLTFDPSAVCGHIPTAANKSTTEAMYITPNIGWSLIDEVDVEIGGQRIDRQSGKWMNVWNDLTQVNPSCNKGGNMSIPGQFNGSFFSDQVNTIEGNGGGGGVYKEFPTPPAGAVVQNPFPTVRMDIFGNGKGTMKERTSFNVGPSIICQQADADARVNVSYASVPLDFWFCRNPGLALPLIALQYHEVKVGIKLVGSLSNMVVGSISTREKDGSEEWENNSTLVAGNLESVELWADYIYLDTDERRRFAQVSHEYLIEQVQHEVKSSGNSSYVLNFNHPVKELIWCGQPRSSPLVRDINLAFADEQGCSTSGSGATSQIFQGVTVPLSLHNASTGQADANRLHGVGGTDVKWTIKLNGHERFAPRNSGYFTGTQVVNHHSGNAGIIVPESIYVYSFALKPEEHQPSGTCNFSRIDNAQLNCSGVGSTGLYSLGGGGLDVYAVNYNVLRIMSGMGGLAYSN